MKEVLHVFKDYYPPTKGGVEKHINEVVHSLQERFRFVVLTSSRTRNSVQEDDRGVTVFRAAEYWRPVSTPITPSWLRLLANIGPDVAHFHMPNPFGELCYLKSGIESSLIATYHADIVGRTALLPLFRPFQRAFLARARRIVVGSPQVADSSSALVPHKSRLEVIPYGVEAGQWSKRPAVTDDLKKRYPGRVVLFVGRLAYYKGTEVLIKAMTAVDASCLLIGDGPKRNYLEDLASSLGVADRVRFLGEIPDSGRAAYYHLADVFVLPSTSRAESFGIAMLEALACGTPAISTELGTGTSWVNQDNSTGLVVPPNDPAALAHALRRLLADEALRRDMGAAAAARAREHFSRDSMIASLTQVYSSI